MSMLSNLEGEIFVKERLLMIIMIAVYGMSK